MIGYVALAVITDRSERRESRRFAVEGTGVAGVVQLFSRFRRLCLPGVVFHQTALPVHLTRAAMIANAMSRQRAAVQPPPPLLSAVPPAVVHEFAKVAVTGILKGETSSKGFTKAAKQLETTVEAVSQAVSAVSNIYSRASRANLSYQQLVDFLSIQGYGEALRLALADYFIERVGEMREYVSLAVLQMPTYRSLDWRLDLQIASRSLRHQSAPVFVLSVTIQPPRIFQKTDKEDQGEETKVVFLEAKYATLKAVCSQLELAIGEARSGAHGQRVMRLFK